jgi:alpha-L-fucosidase
MKRPLCLPPLVALFALAVAGRCCGQPADVERDPRVLAHLEKFQDWKFGLMMHWGIYSQWGCIESWPLVEADRWARPDDLRPWLERGRDFARFVHDYRALNSTFRPRHFDPARWAAAAKAAGMKYVVFTAKHHDGFCMFDTRQTDYRTTHASCPFHTDPQADVLRAVLDAFRKQGFGIGVYYSKSDWHHPGYWDPALPHRDRNVNYDTHKYPEKWKTFVDFTHAVVEELMSGYGPVDILWLDGGQVRPPEQDIDMPRLAAVARRHQPGLIVVDRTVGGRYENYRTPEQEVPAQPLPGPWESCLTMGEQWSYKPGDHYKSPRTLVHLLVDIVSKGGNFLLNVGPDADGRFPVPAGERLEALGRWMRVNSPAIDGTRPIAPYKQGRVCWTRKGQTVYLIVLAEKDETGPPAQVKAASPGAVRSVRMLGAAEPVSWKAGAAALTVDIPEGIRRAPPCEHAWTLEVVLAGTAAAAGP